MKTILLLMLLGVLAALPAGSQAASVSYIGADGNAYLATPDGSRSVKLTTDGTAADKYEMAGQADDGQIVVYRSSYFTWLNPDGSRANGPWRIGASSSALSPHVSPGGTLVAYHTFSAGPTFRTVIMAKGPVADLCTFGCVNDVVRPRWVPGAQAGFLDYNLNVLSVQVPGYAAPQEWFTVGGHKISSFDVSRTDKIVIEAFPDSGSSVKSLAVLRNNGLPPSSPTPTLLCELPNFSTAGGYPRWSPDGSMIAWEDPAGVQVSPAPVNRGDGTCSLSPRLIAAGGHSPDWGPKDVPAAKKQDDKGDPRKPDPVAVKLKAGRLPRLGKALRRGITISLRSDQAGLAKVELVAGGKLARGVAKRKTKVVGRGSKRIAKPGTVKVKVRFTRKAKRRYRRVRKLTLRARATVTTASGVKGVATRKIVLKR